MDSSRETLLELQRLPENQRCFNCGTLYPLWADVYHGVFICFNCASHHRCLGPRISRVLSLVADTWTREDLLSLKNGGNAKAFEHLGTKEEFHEANSIRKKYQSETAYIYRQILAANNRGQPFTNSSKNFLNLISEQGSILAQNSFAATKGKGLRPEIDNQEKETGIKHLLSDLDAQDQENFDPLSFFHRRFSNIGSRFLSSGHDSTPATILSRNNENVLSESPTEVSPSVRRDTDFISGITSGVSLLKTSVFGAGQKGLQLASALVQSSGKSSFFGNSETEMVSTPRPQEVPRGSRELVMETSARREDDKYMMSSQDSSIPLDPTEKNTTPYAPNEGGWDHDLSWGSSDWDADEGTNKAQVSLVPNIQSATSDSDINKPDIPGQLQQYDAHALENILKYHDLGSRDGDSIFDSDNVVPGGNENFGYAGEPDKDIHASVSLVSQHSEQDGDHSDVREGSIVEELYCESMDTPRDGGISNTAGTVRSHLGSGNSIENLLSHNCNDNEDAIPGSSQHTASSLTRAQLPLDGDNSYNGIRYQDSPADTEGDYSGTGKKVIDPAQTERYDTSSSSPKQNMGSLSLYGAGITTNLGDVPIQSVISTDISDLARACKESDSCVPTPHEAATHSTDPLYEAVHSPRSVTGALTSSGAFPRGLGTSDASLSRQDTANETQHGPFMPDSRKSRKWAPVPSSEDSLLTNALGTHSNSNLADPGGSPPSDIARNIADSRIGAEEDSHKQEGLPKLPLEGWGDI